MGAHADLVVWLGAEKAIHGAGQFTNSPARVVDSPAVDNARAARKPGGLDWDAGAPQFHQSVSAFANACSAPANAGSVVLLQELLADAHAPQEHGTQLRADSNKQTHVKVSMNCPCAQSVGAKPSQPIFPSGLFPLGRCSRRLSLVDALLVLDLCCRLVDGLRGICGQIKTQKQTDASTNEPFLPAYNPSEPIPQSQSCLLDLLCSLLQDQHSRTALAH